MYAVLAAVRLVVYAGALALALSASVQAAPGENPASLHIDEVRERVVAWVPVGGLVERPETRNIGWLLPEYGWVDSWFIIGVYGMLTANDRGLHRVLLHTPFGRVKPVQFDQYLEAQHFDTLAKVTGGFVDSWRNHITDPALGLGIEVISYIGSPRLDWHSQMILWQDGEQAFYDYAWDAVDPLLQAGMSVGLDAAAAATEDSATHSFAQMLREQGTKVYIEATPRADHEWWFDYPTIVIEETWQERKQDPRFASRGDINAELIRIVRTSKQWANTHSPREWPQEACRVIAEGDTLAASFVLLRQAQRSIQDLVDCANAYLAGDQGGS